MPNSIKKQKTQGWVYDADKYRDILIKSLPVKNFHKFVADTLVKEFQMDLEKIEDKKYLALSGLIFEKCIDLEYKEGKRFEVKMKDCTYDTPVIKITRAVN